MQKNSKYIKKNVLILLWSLVGIKIIKFKKLKYKLYHNKKFIFSSKTAQLTSRIVLLKWLIIYQNIISKKAYSLPPSKTAI